MRRIRDLRRVAAAEPALFLALDLLALLPLLLIRHVISIDGPSHLEGAEILLHHGRPLVAHFYRIDTFPSPNLLTELLLAALLKVAAPVTAEKLLVGAYVVAFPFAVRYAVRSVAPDARALAYLAFPFVYQRLLLYGFYNYCYAVVLAVVTIGYVLRHPLPWRPRTTAGCAALLLVTYLTHLLPFLVAVAALAVVTVVALWVRRPTVGGPRRLLPALGPVAALVPPFALAAAYALHTRSGPLRPAWSTSTATRVVQLLTLRLPIATLRPGENVAAAVLGLALLLFALVTLVAGRADAARDPSGRGVACAVAGAVTTIAFLATPEWLNLDYGFLPERLAFFPALFLLLWCASRQRRRRSEHRFVGLVTARAAVAVVAVGVAVGVVALRAPVLRHYNREVDEVTSTVRLLRPGSTLVVQRLWLDPPRGGVWHTTDPLRHIGSLVAAMDGGVDLAHYEAQLPYFPTQFRRPFLFASLTGHVFTAGEAVPPRATVLDATTVRPDYVLVVGERRATRRTLRTPAVRRMLAVLRADYRLVGVSHPSGLVAVYARRA